MFRPIVATRRQNEPRGLHEDVTHRARGDCLDGWHGARAGSAAAKPDAAEAKRLIANERALQDAVGKADKSAFESLVLLSDGFWVMRDGFLLMRQLADALDVFKLTKWDIVNPRVTWLSEGSAIVNYVWTATGTLFDQPVTPIQSAVTVWTRRNGKWLAVSHQQTEIVNPGPR